MNENTNSLFYEWQQPDNEWCMYGVVNVKWLNARLPDLSMFILQRHADAFLANVLI